MRALKHLHMDQRSFKWWSIGMDLVPMLNEIVSLPEAMWTLGSGTRERSPLLGDLWLMCVQERMLVLDMFLQIAYPGIGTTTTKGRAAVARGREQLLSHLLWHMHWVEWLGCGSGFIQWEG